MCGGAWWTLGSRRECSAYSSTPANTPNPDPNLNVNVDVKFNLNLDVNVKFNPAGQLAEFASRRACWTYSSTPTSTPNFVPNLNLNLDLNVDVKFPPGRLTGGVWRTLGSKSSPRRRPRPRVRAGLGGPRGGWG